MAFHEDGATIENNNTLYRQTRPRGLYESSFLVRAEEELHRNAFPNWALASVLLATTFHLDSICKRPLYLLRNDFPF